MDERPRFRPDLRLSRYDDVAERKTVILKDPVSERYYYLSEYEYALLVTLDGTMTIEEAVERLKSLGRYYDLEDARLIVAKAGQMGLLLGTRFSSARFQAYLKEQSKRAKRARRFSSVYFLFIPLINPDRFLERTLWIARLIANKWTVALLALAAPGALYLVIQGMPKIEKEYLFFFNWHNLLYLWITIALTKLFHEFGHAYVAKSYGLHVPQMGIAFLIFFPCLFCNTTDAWQLADRRQRIAISSAGILVEAALAVISTYIWHFTKPGMVNSLAFYLMAVSFISTVLFNGNPLMRFDGYFILMDYLRIPNLSTRSFGYMKYLFMNRVLGNSLVPNTATSPRETFIFSLYGVCATMYRVFLYTGIVLGVYFRFDKTLGIVLALIAFALFIVRPVAKGVESILRKRQDLRPRPLGIAVLAIMVIGVVTPLVIPVGRISMFPCYLASCQIQKLTVPLKTSVDHVFVDEGAKVSKGEILFTLDTSVLKLSLVQMQLEREIVGREIKMILLDDERRGEVAGKEVELQRLDDAIDRIRHELAVAEGGATAPFDGVVTGLDYRMQQGFQPGEGIIVGEVESQSDCVVRALIPGTDLDKVREGQEVKIWFPLGTGEIFAGKIDNIKSFSETDLKNSPFSSRLGGEVATEEKGEGKADAPLEAQYQCSVMFPNHRGGVPLGMTGKFVVHAPPKPLLVSWLDRFARVFNRESLF